MIYILDTNILVHAIRESALFSDLNKRFQLTNAKNQNVISVVTIGELYSLATRNHWGKRRKDKIELLLKEFNIVPVSDARILHEAYANIDAFSQRNHPTMTLKGSARKMGKNDLWIAATTSVFNGTLLTTDGDFHHLHNTFFPVAYINPELY